jgi:hypothetical protein
MRMMRPGLTFGLLAGVLLAIWALRPVAREVRPAAAVTLQARPVTGTVPTVFSTGVQTSGLGHEEPPDPQALRNAPNRQAVYDAEAKPGQFVTPPNVSVEH